MHQARRALIIVPLVMSVALVATVLATYFNVRRVVVTAEHGYGDALLDAIRRFPQATFDEAIASFLEEQGQEGLRCIAQFDGEGNLQAAVGDCAADPAAVREALLASRSEELIDLGERSRMVRGAQSQRPLLVEFEPVATRELERGALRGLGIGGAASLALVVVAVGLWRLTLREERLMEAVERDRRLASLGEMAAVLAHEIRNPLTAMKGHAQLLAERLPSDSRDGEKAERVVREAVRLEQLTADLLSFVRSEQLERREVDPAEVLEAAVDEVGRDRIDIDRAQAPKSWSLDPPLMQRVLANLLRNALQASPDGARVEARLMAENGQLIFRVRDRGEGIPAAERERIFEPFYTTRLRGTGLGLAVARRIATLHHGTIEQSDAPGGGAIFSLAVPKA